MIFQLLLVCLTIASKLWTYLEDRGKITQAQRELLYKIEGDLDVRIKKATTARNDVLSGRVPVDPNDPYRRD